MSRERRESSELSITIGGLELTALVWGEESQPVVLALHGWLDNAQSFAPLAAELSEYRLIALELPGHGHSAHLPEGVFYHFIDSSRIVLEVMDALGLVSADLIGHSLGGAIASVMAGAFPERIRRLVLIDSFGTLVDDPQESPRSLRTHVNQWLELRQKALPVYPDVRKAAVARVVVGDLDFDNALLLAERGTKQVPGGVTWRTDPRLRVHSALRLSEAQSRAFLAEITAPCLYIQASKGLEFVRKAAAMRRDAVRRLTVCELQGGHHVHMQNPTETAEAIRRFFSAH